MILEEDLNWSNEEETNDTKVACYENESVLKLEKTT